MECEPKFEPNLCWSIKFLNTSLLCTTKQDRKREKSLCFLIHMSDIVVVVNKREEVFKNDTKDYWNWFKQAKVDSLLGENVQYCFMH